MIEESSEKGVGTVVLLVSIQSPLLDPPNSKRDRRPTYIYDRIYDDWVPIPEVSSSCEIRGPISLRWTGTLWGKMRCWQDVVRSDSLNDSDRRNSSQRVYLYYRVQTSLHGNSCTVNTNQWRVESEWDRVGVHKSLLVDKEDPSNPLSNLYNVEIQSPQRTTSKSLSHIF